MIFTHIYKQNPVVDPKIGGYCLSRRSQTPEGWGIIWGVLIGESLLEGVISFQIRGLASTSWSTTGHTWTAYFCCSMRRGTSRSTRRCCLGASPAPNAGWWHHRKICESFLKAFMQFGKWLSHTDPPKSAGLRTGPRGESGNDFKYVNPLPGDTFQAVRQFSPFWWKRPGG